MPRLSSRFGEDAPRGELSRAPAATPTEEECCRPRTWPGECAFALRKLLCGESRAESRALRCPRGEVSLLPASPPRSSALFALLSALSALLSDRSALACTASTSATSSSVVGASRGGGAAQRRRSTSPSAAVTRAAVTEAVTTSAVVGAPPGIDSFKFGEINGGRSAPIARRGKPRGDASAARSEQERLPYT